MPFPFRGTMRDFPSCFGESGIQVLAAAASSSASGRNAQNMVSCVYLTRLSSRTCLITISWSRNLMGRPGFNISIDDNCTRQSICKSDIKPWLLPKWKGSKSLDAVDSGKVDVFWDFTSAKFGSGPEPLEGFYVGVVSDLEMVLLLGDMHKDAYRKSNVKPPPWNASYIAKRDHVVGKGVFCSTAQFCDNGQVHDIAIECEATRVKDSGLEIHIDKKKVLSIKHLTWKFRGNQTIVIDGLPVEILWDVHNWLFGSSGGSAVFLFQSQVSADKLLPWSDIAPKEGQLQGVGFSLVLYALRTE